MTDCASSLPDIWQPFLHSGHDSQRVLQIFNRILHKLFTSSTNTTTNTCRIGIVSEPNRCWVYRIISATVVSADIRASMQVHQLLTDRITHDDQRVFKRPVTRPPRPHACVLFYGPWYGRGLKGREAEGDCVTERLVSGYKDGAVPVLATITPHSLHQQEVITTVNCQSL